MSNDEHLKIIKQGYQAWNNWRDQHPGIVPEFIEADLRGADLRGINLAGANLGGARIEGADLTMANLRGASLRWADLTEARLIMTNLAGAEIYWAKLVRAELNHADLDGAGLIDSDLDSACLTSVSLKSAKIRAASLNGTNFAHATFDETIFCNVDLSSVDGLDDCLHLGPSCVDYRTLRKSNGIPHIFWRGCGLPDELIDYMPSLTGDAIQFYSCFISYSHADKSFARRLHDTLQGRGIRCWLDEKQILPGDKVFDEVSQGIRLSDKTLLCCSETSLESWWVENELDEAFAKEQALRREKGRKRLVVIPLDLDGYLFNWKDGKAVQVRSRLAADFTDWEKDNEKFEVEFERVVSALKAENEARESPQNSKF